MSELDLSHLSEADMREALLLMLYLVVRYILYLS